MNLNQIIQSAQGGQGIDNLAAQFGLSSDQAQSAVQALIPALSGGLQKAMANPGALGQILGHVADDQHQASYADPAAAQSPSTTQAGEDALNQVLGGSQDEIANAIATRLGIPADTVRSMMPQVTSMVLGGVASHLQQSGLGGALGQLAQAAQSGGLGSILGGLLGGGAQGSGGGLGGMLGGLVGSLLGGQSSQAPAQGSAPAQTGGIDPATVQAGMQALGKLFQPGTSTSSGLESEISSILSKNG